MTTGVFVAGTDTGVGKTQVTLALMHALKGRGLVVAGMKPVASGCIAGADGLRNEDAEQIRIGASRPFPYALVNPYAFIPAVAPHIAAREAGVSISEAVIESAFRELATVAEVVVVEGVGGWRVPLEDGRGMDQVAVRLGLPVVLVVGMRLGCLNHALLTYEAILRSGLSCAGWVANQVDPDMEYLEENIDTLRQGLDAPCLGVIPYISALDAGQVASYLDITSFSF